MGYSGINVTGGGGGPTEPNILNPKKYMDLILRTQKKYKTGHFRPKKIHKYNTKKYISADFSDPKKYTVNLQPKKIQELKILDPKKYVGPPVTFIPE